MSKQYEKPSGENFTSKITEDWLDEFLALADGDGYWGLVQRDKSEWGSIYVWLHYPPASLHQLPRPSNFNFRISDHPPPSHLVKSMLGSVHPGQDDVRKEWRKAKVKIREYYDEQKRQAASSTREHVEIVRHITQRKKR